jgi:hypothetical protein
MSTGDILEEGDRCVGLTTLPPSCADCLEILGGMSVFKAYYTCKYFTGNDSALICVSGSSASLSWFIGLNEGDDIDSNIIVFCHNVNCIISIMISALHPLLFAR